MTENRLRDTERWFYRRGLPLVMTVAQVVQVTLVAVVVWAFFVILGVLAIPVELQSLWLGGSRRWASSGHSATGTA